MGLTWTEMESVTNDYFMADNGKALDIYFDTSYLLNYLLKQQKGLWERPDGGLKIRVPIEYDEGVGGFYVKGDTVSSDDREMVNAVYFDWIHAYGNATVYRIDGLENAGRYAEVSLITQRTANAQKTITKRLAGSLYDTAGAAASRLTGLRACCNETATTKYAGMAENDLVAHDGTKSWEGKMTSTSQAISLNVIRTAATNAKLRDGPKGKPDLVVLQEVQWNVIADILQAQQRFTDSTATVDAGFTGLKFEGKDIFPDDYCPTGYMFAINSAHIGFAVHQEGNFMRTKWKVIPDSPEDKTMKIYWDGNMIVNDRRAHQGHSGLQAPA